MTATPENRANPMTAPSAVAVSGAATGTPAVQPAPPVPQPKRSRVELQEDAARARAELAAALDAIEDKLNVPKQFDRALQRTRRAVSDNPIALGAIALGVASAIGLGVFAIIRAAQK